MEVGLHDGDAMFTKSFTKTGVGESTGSVYTYGFKPHKGKKFVVMLLGDLAEMGYDAQWCIVSASDCGAPHQRERIWIVANANGSWEPQPARIKQDSRMGAEQRSETLANASSRRCSQPATWKMEQPWRAEVIRTGQPIHADWPIEPGLGRVVNGMANRLDRLKALGNGQVPRVAATAFTILSIDD